MLFLGFGRTSGASSAVRGEDQDIRRESIFDSHERLILIEYRKITRHLPITQDALLRSWIYSNSLSEEASSFRV
jgi:hypothetical protein